MPAFLTPRCSSSLDNSLEKDCPQRIKSLLWPAQGWEGGLAPAQFSLTKSVLLFAQKYD
jgi:hypothetical protein